MFSLVLTFVACIGAARRRRCRQVELPWDGSLMQCMLFGQHEAAHWTNASGLGGHPRLEMPERQADLNAAVDWRCQRQSRLAGYSSRRSVTRRHQLTGISRERARCPACSLPEPATLR